MKLALAIASVLFASDVDAQRAASAPPPATRWRVTSERSQMTDDRTVVARLDADASVAGYGGVVSRPTIILRCREKQFEAYVSTDFMLDPDAGTSRIRWDNDSATYVNWGRSTDYTSMFISSPETFARKLLSHRRVRIEVPPLNKLPAVVSFSIVGLAGVFGPMARECGADLHHAEQDFKWPVIGVAPALPTPPPPPPSPPPVVYERFSVLGVGLGDSLANVRPHTPHCTRADSVGYQECTRLNASVGDAVVDVQFDLLNDRVFRIRLRYPAASFASFRSWAEQAFGPPTGRAITDFYVDRQRLTSIQNSWRFQVGELRAHEYGTPPDHRRGHALIEDPAAALNHPRR